MQSESSKMPALAGPDSADESESRGMPALLLGPQAVQPQLGWTPNEASQPILIPSGDFPGAGSLPAAFAELLGGLPWSEKEREEALSDARAVRASAVGVEPVLQVDQYSLDSKWHANQLRATIGAKQTARIQVTDTRFANAGKKVNQSQSQSLIQSQSSSRRGTR